MKVLSCKDVGVNCDFQARGRTVDEVLRKAGDHARKDHNVRKVTRDYVSAWKMKIHDE